MPKQKIPERPYYEVRHEYDAARKRFDDAALMLYNSVDMILRNFRAQLPEALVKPLDEKCAAFRDAAFPKE